MKNRNGFTLIELLVVIAIISLLAAILFPVFAQAREKARETTCVSNLKQIGLAVRMYVQDYDETFPIFHAYNSAIAPWQPGHKGVEMELDPYTKSKQIFRCPDDNGSPFQKTDAPGTESYYEAYGSSYRFQSRCFTLVPGVDGSYQNNAEVDTASGRTETIVDADFVNSSQTRIMRDDMLAFFDPKNSPHKYDYGYFPKYYTQWHPRGGGFVFADGHAKFIASETAFRDTYATADGRNLTKDDCWWDCD